MAERLSGRAALVTGGWIRDRRGVRETACRARARVLIVDRDREGAERVRHEVADAGAHAEVFVAELTDPRPAPARSNMR